jgi:hypothetical protein
MKNWVVYIENRKKGGKRGNQPSKEDGRTYLAKNEEKEEKEEHSQARCKMKKENIERYRNLYLLMRKLIFLKV